MAIRITFNGNNIDLDIGKNGLRIKPMAEFDDNRAGSGIIERINQYCIQEFEFDAHFLDAVYYQLWGWWAWAKDRRAWSFSLDSNNVGNTTLDAAAAAGQKVIPLTATAAFAIDDICLIRTAARSDFEVVTIASISAGVSVTVDNNLYFTYASGDEFRHFDYFPSVISMDKEFDPDRSGSTWSHTFKFIEAFS